MSGTMPTVLATIFFGLAFLWFLIAVAYAASVVMFLRMRRQGLFLNVRVNDPTFGRYYFCNNRFYLPMGWIFRRFIVQYQTEQDRKKNNGRSMTKIERRQAMAILLSAATGKGDDDDAVTEEKQPELVHASVDTTSQSDSESSNHTTIDEELGNLEKTTLTSSSSQCNVNNMEEQQQDNDDQDEHVCSICLGPYRNEASIWKSSVCNHQFHRTCLLNWLGQPGKTECPCCRVPFVQEEDVWKTVKRQRRYKARATTDTTMVCGEHNTKSQINNVAKTMMTATKNGTNTASTSSSTTSDAEVSSSTGTSHSAGSSSSSSSEEVLYDV
jgi:hypothetical protein